MKVKLLTPNAILPTKAHDTDAGFDIYAQYDFNLLPIIHSDRGFVNIIETGIAVEVPDGRFCLLKERSSLALKGMVITAGVIDYEYRGEIKIVCFNISDSKIFWRAGDKIAQLIVLPLFMTRAEEVDDVSKTKRGDGGFGSSGR